MADVKKIIPFILKWEGGYVNHVNDIGGPTNMGVTLGTWKAQGYDKDKDGDIDAEDIKLLTVEDVTGVLKKSYWDRWQGDKITDQAVANTLVDWVWGSGFYGITIPQQILGFKGKLVDGLVGDLTINRLNERIAANKAGLIEAIYEARYNFLSNIIKNNPSQKVFYKGWINRMNDLVAYNKTLV